MANILHLVLPLTQNCKTVDKTLTLIISSLKGQPGARSSCAGSGKGPTTLGLLYAVILCISARGCFQDSSL